MQHTERKAAPVGKNARDFENFSEEMVGETGFEPATLWSQTRCATRLRYSPTWDHWYNNVRAAGCLPVPAKAKAGGPGGTRTPDLAVMSGQL